LNSQIIRAKSIVDCSKRDMKYTLSLKVTPESSATIVRNIYESFRMLGDALLLVKGVKSQDHVEQIKEIIKLNVNTKRSLMVLQNLRTLRHSINYQGYSPNLKEVEDALDISKELYEPVLHIVQIILKSK